MSSPLGDNGTSDHPPSLQHSTHVRRRIISLVDFFSLEPSYYFCSCFFPPPAHMSPWADTGGAREEVFESNPLSSLSFPPLFFTDSVSCHIRFLRCCIDFSHIGLETQFKATVLTTLSGSFSRLFIAVTSQDSLSWAHRIWTGGSMLPWYLYINIKSEFPPALLLSRLLSFIFQCVGFKVFL